MALKVQLDSLRDEIAAAVGPELVEAMHDADRKMHEAGVASRALRAGATAPSFRLFDRSGRKVALVDLLAAGPVVISFYRGGWCAYCGLELAALQHVHPEISVLGATLVAIAPESVSAPQPDDPTLPFATLIDRHSKVAELYGLTYILPEVLRPNYEAFGYKPAAEQAANRWTVSIPATYVIDRSGRIVLAFTDIDYRNRLEPDQILASLRGLARRG